MDIRKSRNISSDEEVVEPNSAEHPADHGASSNKVDPSGIVSCADIVDPSASISTPRCGGNKFDFGRASARSIIETDGEVPDFKNFLIKMSSDENVSMIRSAKKETANIFNKVSRKFMVDIKKLIITYPLKQADGSELIVKIENTPDLDETLGHCQLRLLQKCNYGRKKQEKLKSLKFCLKVSYNAVLRHMQHTNY